MAFVADNSVIFAWFVASQANNYTRALLDRAANEVIHVPAIWRAEFASAMLAFTHNRRIRPAAVPAIMNEIDQLDMITDSSPPSVRGLIELAQRHALGAYDACYLELALRLGIPLAASDVALRKAAARANILLA